MFSGLFQTDHSKDEIVDILLRSVPGAVLITKDIVFREVIHNPDAAAFLRIQPYEPFSFASIPPFRMFSKGTEIEAKQLPLRRAVKFGEIIVNEEFEFVWPDGISKTALFSAKPLSEKGGKIFGAIATLEDITFRKQIEEDLSASEERYRSLFENSIDAILLTSPSGQIHYVNPVTCAMFQWTEEELLPVNLKTTAHSVPKNAAKLPPMTILTLSDLSRLLRSSHKSWNSF